MEKLFATPLALLCLAAFASSAAVKPAETKCLSLLPHARLQALRNECVQFENATAPPKLGAETQKQFLCVLFLASYDRACAKNVSLPEGELEGFNVSFVCAHKDVLVEGAEAAAKLIADNLACAGSCLDLDKGGTEALPLCSTAFYLNNATRFAGVKAEEPTKAVGGGAEAKEENLPDVGQQPQQNVPQPREESEHTPKDQAVQQQKVNQNAEVAAPAGAASPQKAAPKEIETLGQPPDQPEVVANEDERAEHPKEETPAEQNHETVPAKPAEQPSPQQQAVPPNKNEEPKKPEEIPKDNKAVGAPPNTDAETPDQQQQQRPHSVQKTEDHVDSPPLVNEDANNALLNANENETPEDMKFEEGEDDDDDGMDDQGELKFNKPSSDNKAEASVPQKPDKTYSSPMNSSSTVDGDSYFFSYFMMLCIIIVLFYVGYHNKQKIRAIVLEGPRSRRQYRSRRPNSANYHKLDSNLEEAISSPTGNKGSSHVIY